MTDPRVNIRVVINGQTIEAQVNPNRLLVDFLRDDLGLTGTKIGCGEGECGACTVIIDGKTANSCLVLAVQIEGKQVTTVEGIGSYELLHPLQKAFMEEGAVQCGYCTPGMLLSAKALLDHHPQPTRTEIIEGISGNLCRCTGYAKIIQAVEKVAHAKNAADGGGESCLRK